MNLLSQWTHWLSCDTGHSLESVHSQSQRHCLSDFCLSSLGFLSCAHIPGCSRLSRPRMSWSVLGQSWTQVPTGSRWCFFSAAGLLVLWDGHLPSDGMLVAGQGLPSVSLSLAVGWLPSGSSLPQCFGDLLAFRGEGDHLNRRAQIVKPCTDPRSHSWRLRSTIVNFCMSL